MSREIAPPKAVFVGPLKMGEAFASRRSPEWNFTAIVQNIDDLWAGLNTGEIDDDIQAIVTCDIFFDPTGFEVGFEQLIAGVSPFCFFGILQYYPEHEPQIRERVDSAANNLGNGEIVEYYFIDPKKTNGSTDRALNHYIQNTPNRATANILQGIAPEYEETPEVQETKAAEIIENTYIDDAEVDGDYMGQVIAVTSSKGGSGKSTIALSLATYLAHASEASYADKIEDRPLKIIIVDLDTRDGQIGFLIGTLSPSVLHMRNNGIDEKTFRESVIHSDKLKVDILLAPKRARLAMDTPPEFYLELIQFLKRRYDYVILDTSVSYLDPLLESVAYPIADRIVFVTDIVINSVNSMARWIQEVTGSKSKQGMGIPVNKIGIVVNKSISNVNMSGEKIAAATLGIKVIAIVPNNAKLIAHAMNLQSIESVLKHKDILNPIRRLGRSIVGKRYELSDNLKL